MVAFASNAAYAHEINFEGVDFLEEKPEEEVDESSWVNEVYFPKDLIINEYKSQAIRAIKRTHGRRPYSQEAVYTLHR